MDNKSLSHTKWKCQFHIVFIQIVREPVLMLATPPFGASINIALRRSE